MIVSTLVKSYTFKDPNPKKAYLDGCRYIAKYISKQNKYKNVTFRCERINNQNVAEFRFHIYATLDLKDKFKKRCATCKQFHQSFFINQEYNCDKCALKSFIKSLEIDIAIIKNFYKGLIKD